MTTDAYPNGVVEALVDVDKLRQAVQQMNVFQQSIKIGADVKIDELIQYGIVRKNEPWGGKRDEEIEIITWDAALQNKEIWVCEYNSVSGNIKNLHKKTSADKKSVADLFEEMRVDR